MIDQKLKLACGKGICLASISFALIWSSVAFADVNPGTQRVLDRLTDTSQAIVVEGRKGVQAELRAFEKIGSTWTEKFHAPAVIGKKGFAPEGEKKRGRPPYPCGDLHGRNGVRLRTQHENDRPLPPSHGRR